ncbi:transcriptional regulator [Sphingomonas sp. GCM10030256]|uniref:winged helix-turn-helix domain-containing protein n=1 Tax=Sphingomonas sp. GCM10030256 TaxID=3273427 RepID=UPI003619445D
MHSGDDILGFDRFVLDPANRQLREDGRAVELNGRYLDALLLMVREAGRLVSKDRFMDEVWRGIPVTDEALTQCIRTLRRQLGDSAAAPRFIETVPKHGYRFIGEVQPVVGDEPAQRAATLAENPVGSGGGSPIRRVLLLTGAGVIGGGTAGLIGGLVYGFAGASQPLQPGLGAVSVLLVLMCLTIAVAILGAAGVSFGVAVASLAADRRWMVPGGAIGGLVVGALVKLLGLDAFSLLLGQSPGDITGAGEGVAIGAAVGLAAWLGWVRSDWPRPRRIALASLCGAIAGVLVALLGGTLMGGSLDLLAQHIPSSRLQIDAIGAWFGETGFGPVTRVVTGALEGGLFAAGVTGAILAARRDVLRSG